MIRRATTDDVEEIVAIFEPSFALLDFLPQLHTHEEHLAFFGRCVRDGEAYRPRSRLRDPRRRLADAPLRPPGRDRDRRRPRRCSSTCTTLRPDGFQFWVFQQNERARRFYEAHGAVAVEFTDGEHNEEKTPDVATHGSPPA